MKKQDEYKFIDCIHGLVSSLKNYFNVLTEAGSHGKKGESLEKSIKISRF